MFGLKSRSPSRWSLPRSLCLQHPRQHQQSPSCAERYGKEKCPASKRSHEKLRTSELRRQQQGWPESRCPLHCKVHKILMVADLSEPRAARSLRRDGSRDASRGASREERRGGDGSRPPLRGGVAARCRFAGGGGSGEGERCFGASTKATLQHQESSSPSQGQ